ncbi:MAG: aminotransferase [Desulfobacterales bacterium RIFOXYA12_FULL_46_15]|nr:MAG: aminotransferase [Desulfobacula sp. GWF2_41_7]OGR26767.1 MAG: aminotransferase [Desulfobacterales bacterium RIFOXYA12_FULL_46_15]
MTIAGTSNPLFYQTASSMPVVSKAHGIYIWDESGKKYIDACSGAVICNIGHNDEKVIEAVSIQSKSVFFTYRTQFENRPALDLAVKLVENTAPHLERVFYVSGGSEAVESSMKLCRSYFCSIGQAGRYQFISRTPSYHGSTLGALALTSYSPLEKPYRPLLQTYPKIPAPYCYRCHYEKKYPQCNLRCASALEQMILEQGPENVAAFICEPIGGASTGALVPPDGYFTLIMEICDKYGILLILDEVMTGFGRTGKLFAYEHWNLKADIVAFSKGMASGYYPLGAIMAREHIVQTVMDHGGFPHGHTYAGNPMACAVGLSVFNRIIEDNLSGNADRMGVLLKTGLLNLAEKYPFIGEVRGKGLLTALEFVQDNLTRKPFDPAFQMNSRITGQAFAEGLLVYPRRPINGLAGDHVLIAPPLIVTEKQIDEILSRLDRALNRVALSLREDCLG